MTTEKEVIFLSIWNSFSLERLGELPKVSSQEEERAGFQIRLPPRLPAGQH